jgi:hypothetical protein
VNALKGKGRSPAHLSELLNRESLQPKSVLIEAVMPRQLRIEYPGAIYHVMNRE